MSDYTEDFDMRRENTKGGSHLVSTLPWQPALVNGPNSSQMHRAPIGGHVKRTFDVAAAAMGALMLLPILLMIALLIKFSGSGPILYRHKRVGFGGREFDCLKFRTMVTNGDEVLKKHFDHSPGAYEEWLETRKLTNDPRITSIGALLRKSSLDELPQILNILHGDMSIVGPRPVVQEELAMYGPNSFYYLQTRPGLTGIWQISGRSDTSYSQRVSLDTEYVSTWSLRTDLWIILCTVPAVILAKGSR